MEIVQGTRTLNGIPVSNIWLLMAYAAQSSLLKERTKSSFIDNPDKLPDLICELLSFAVRNRILFGLTPEHLPRFADLDRVRGKINFLRTGTHNLLDRGKVACLFNELSLDTPRNRLVAAALNKLLRIVSNKAIADEARNLLRVLMDLGVKLIPDLLRERSEFQLGRHDARDQEMIELAKLANWFQIPSEARGLKSHIAANKDEHWIRRLFEKAIAGFYRKTLRQTDTKVRTGKVLRWPLTSKSEGIDAVLPRMQADIIIDRPNVGLIIDTKFTDIYKSGWRRESTLRSSYLYQIYTYLRSQENVESFGDKQLNGLLLHPSTGESIFETMILQDHRLSFATIDLTLPAEGIKQKLAEIYERASSS